MITLTDYVKGDLIDDVNNFDIMAIIEAPDRTFYISTKEQYFKAVDENDVEEMYFEDLDLRISGLKESLNFKSKKVKLSGTTITLNNYVKNDERFTDKTKFGILNSKVKIYLKTGGCRSIADCAPLATLKITRFDQDIEKVTIQCDEFLSESMHSELPKKSNTLYSEDNPASTMSGKTYEV